MERCSASPAAEMAPTLMAHDAVATVHGPNGTRRQPVATLATGPRTTSLAAAEILTSVRLRVPPHSGSCYVRQTVRWAMDLAGVGVAAWVLTDGDGAEATVKEARLALGAVAPSCGKPARHCDLRIVDPAGADVAPGDTGELWLRGPNLFTHYWNRPDETERAFTDGWYRTGDLGRADEHGFVYITGRIRELIISGGENIYPAEVERVLSEHPAVAQAAVTGRPDARWGEVPVAFVVPQPGEPLESESLEQWCTNRLARYKRPREWIFVDDLPRTSLGKVRKHMLPTVPAR